MEITIDKVVDLITNDKVVLTTSVISLVAALASLNGVIPITIGSLAIGWLTGHAVGQLLLNRQTSRIVEKTVPYENWPDDCYSCGDKLQSTRGQLAIQKSDDKHDIKAVGLCEKCTRTHSTMLDYSSQFQDIYNMNGENIDVEYE